MAGLRKNSETGILLGVCSGISEWSHIPVYIVRIIVFVSFILSFSTTGVVYLFLAGVLSDTAQCNTSNFRFKNLLKPWWKKDFVVNEQQQK